MLEGGGFAGESAVLLDDKRVHRLASEIRVAEVAADFIESVRIVDVSGDGGSEQECCRVFPAAKPNFGIKGDIRKVTRRCDLAFLSVVTWQ